MYVPVYTNKKDRTLIGGLLGLINPLIEIIYLDCALISVCLASKRCFNTRCSIGLRRVNIFCFGRDFICTGGQEQTEANECERKVEF